MKWKNVQFGEFEYNPEHVLLFPEGLIGFEEYQKYILINDEETQPFLWLVSLEDEALSFPLIDPRTILSIYQIEPEVKDATILAVASLQKEVEDSTVNLRSPIIIENKSQKGKQVILDNSAYPFQQPLFPAPLTVQKG
jgi:flagellar assembly factor FliW